MGSFVSIFSRKTGRWVATQTLVSDTPSFPEFGVAIAVDGDTLVVGDQHDRGAGYVFVDAAGRWVQQQKLITDDGESNASLGNAVAVAGDTVVLGEQFPAPDSPGAAYVFARTNGKWIQQQKLAAPDGMVGHRDAFGGAVGVSGDTALVGAYWANPDESGALYVFSRSAGAWSFQQKLALPDVGKAYFGYPLSMRGGYALVGAHSLGQVYLTAPTAGSWSLVQKLVPSDEGVTGLGSAYGVSLTDEQAVVLASGPIAAYVYSFDRPCGVVIK